MEEIYRVFSEELDKHFDRKTCHFTQRFEESLEKNKNDHHLAGLQHQAQQPRLATEADVKPNTKTRERTEGGEADGENYGDNLSARVDDDPTGLTSFGNIAEAVAPEKSIGDTLVNEGAKRQRRVSYPWRYIHQYPPVAYCSPTQPVQH